MRCGWLPVADAPYRKSLSDIVKDSHENSAAHGFYDNEETIETVPSKLALIHSEVSEALESYRDPESDNLVKVPESVLEMLIEAAAKSDNDHDIVVTSNARQLLEKWRNKPRGLDIELADIIIRVADFAGWKGIDLEAAIAKKHAYNVTRPHKHGRVV